MRHGSLFSGIGGFDLAAEWMGWENVFHCEWNKFGQQVLKHYWPDAELFTDITKSDFTKYANKIDVLTGGFPCQPYSTAGKRLGKADDRHLWPEMLRAIREIQPRWVVGENVSGLINWNGGLVFDEVQADLEAAGYEVIPFLLPACAVNAPHRRDRIWFVAHSVNNRYNSIRESEGEKNCVQGISWQAMDTGEPNGTNISWDAPHPGSIEPQGGLHKDGTREAERYISPRSSWFNQRGTWDNFPTESPVRGRNDGIPAGLAGITVSKHRQESIKGYGNAVVPQVVLQIFKAIQEYENIITETTC